MSNQPSTVYAPDEWSDHYVATFAGLRERNSGWCRSCDRNLTNCYARRLGGDPEGCCAACDHYETDPTEGEIAR